ncbi:hypothetical protein VNO78_17777 [Psophocarpus tetragonolobus]|uniref:Uncharacterized protein n=1 Tax=Psophocarpus tetragonolobus TaxID=3891 RepID=A0AAN9SI72_PSOTE
MYLHGYKRGNHVPLGTSQSVGCFTFFVEITMWKTGMSCGPEIIASFMNRSRRKRRKGSGGGFKFRDRDKIATPCLGVCAENLLPFVSFWQVLVEFQPHKQPSTVTSS